MLCAFGRSETAVVSSGMTSMILWARWRPRLEAVPFQFARGFGARFRPDGEAQQQQTLKKMPAVTDPAGKSWRGWRRLRVATVDCALSCLRHRAGLKLSDDPIKLLHDADRRGTISPADCRNFQTQVAELPGEIFGALKLLSQIGRQTDPGLGRKGRISLMLPIRKSDCDGR
jgi:hypothetical protein